MLERRRQVRSRAFAAATIACGQRRAALDCVVRNLSEGGAMLLVEEARCAPVEVDLALQGGTRRARVVWRGAMEVGVAFAPAAATAQVRPAASVVVCLDAARRERRGGSDEQRLAARIARFVRRPGPV